MYMEQMTYAKLTGEDGSGEKIVVGICSSPHVLCMNFVELYFSFVAVHTLDFYQYEHEDVSLS